MRVMPDRADWYSYSSDWIIDPSVRFGVNAGIGNYVVIDENCLFDNDVFIGSHVMIRSNVIVGARCKIGHGTVIEQDTAIGNDVNISPQCHITRDAIIESLVFLGPMVCMGNARQICWKRNNMEFESKGPHIQRGARIGMASTLLPGIVIGKNAVIAAGSIVTKDVGENEIWMGCPAEYAGEMPEEERL